MRPGQGTHQPVHRRAPARRRPSSYARSRTTWTGCPTIPTTAGILQLRQAIASWLLQRRFELPAVDPDHQVLPVSGTREALFAFAQAVVSPVSDALVMSPTLLPDLRGAAPAGRGQPHFINCTPDSGLLPDFASVYRAAVAALPVFASVQSRQPHWRGAVAGATAAAGIAWRWSTIFIIAGDECYSEIYFDDEDAAAGTAAGLRRRGRPRLPQLRGVPQPVEAFQPAGIALRFVAGDAVLRPVPAVSHLPRLRHALHHQLGSIAAWNDEQHVIANRQLYRQNSPGAGGGVRRQGLAVAAPDAGFYLAPAEASDTPVARRLYASETSSPCPAASSPGRSVA